MSDKSPMPHAWQEPRRGRIAVAGVAAVVFISALMFVGCRESAHKKPATRPADPPDPMVSKLIDSLTTAPESEARASAAKNLGDMKEKAAPAAGALIQALDDPEIEVRIAAAIALGRIGPDADAAVEPLIKKLQAGNLELRSRAAFSLGRIGSDAARGAVPRLIEMVTDDQVDARRRAATALGHLGKGNPKVAPVLIEATKHGDPRVRNEAVLALKNLGPEASAATAALVHVVRNDKVDRVRKHAALTLGRIQPDDTALAAAGLADGTRDAYMPTRYESLISLGMIGADAAKATGAVVAAMRDPEAKVRETGAPYALKGIGAPAIPHLKAILTDAEAKNRPEAATALGILGAAVVIQPNGARPPLLPYAERVQVAEILTAALSDGDGAVLAAAANALGRLGREAFAAAPALTRLAKDPREPVNLAARRALGSIMTPARRPDVRPTR